MTGRECGLMLQMAVKSYGLKVIGFLPRNIQPVTRNFLFSSCFFQILS